jgi:hypothetical protein
MALAGCVRIDAAFVVGPAGKGDASVQFDFTRLVQDQSDGVPGSSAAGFSRDSLKKPVICDTLADSNLSDEAASFEVGNGLSFADASCVALDDYKARFEWKDIDFVAKGMLRITTEKGRKKYVLELQNDRALASLPQMDAAFDNPLLAKAAGFGLTVDVKMPGGVESASAGTISMDRTTVTVDLVDHPDALSNGIRIVSRESEGIPWLLIGAMVLVLAAIIGGGAYWFVLRKRAKKNGVMEETPPDTTPSYAQRAFPMTDSGFPRGGGIVETLKNAYYAVEDRYYEALDAINAHIPVYAVIDPIDRIFPTLVLFLMLSARFSLVVLLVDLAGLGPPERQGILEHKDAEGTSQKPGDLTLGGIIDRHP